MLRVKYPRGQRPSWDWTTRQLRDYIKEKTRVVNKEYGEFSQLGSYFEKYSEMFTPRIEELQRQAGVKSRKETIGLGLKYKHKDELIAQALEIYRFQEFDVYSPGGMEREEKRKRYRYFKQVGYETPEDFEDWSIETYERKERINYELEREYAYYEAEDYQYDNSQSEWHESLDEREKRTREEIGKDAYDLANVKNKKKFDKFMQNHPDIDLTYDEWEQMVIFAGGIGNTISAELGSEQIVSLMDRRTREGKLDIDVTYRLAFDNVKASGKTITGQEIIDEMARLSSKWGELSKEPI